MKSAVKNNFMIILTVFLVGCSGYLPEKITRWPLNQKERHSWYPPDEIVLKTRRANQIRLDKLSQEIEVLFVNHASLSKEETALLESVSQINPLIETMNSNFGQQIESERQRKKKIQKDLEMSKLGFITAEAKLKKMIEVKPPIIFSISDYNAAMKSFRDGKFEKSLKLFLKLKKQKPPLFLQDNIQFGLGSVYFRLNNYPIATKYFQKILDFHAQGDKRFVSYFMLGVIHNLQGEKSRALYLLEEALEKKPPERMRKMIHRLINVVNDEPSHAAG